MKRIFAAALVVLTMLFSFVLPASAKSSPQASEYPTTPSATAAPGNSSQTSPKTGDPTPMIIFAAAAAAIGVGTLAVKKIKE